MYCCIMFNLWALQLNNQLQRNRLHYWQSWVCTFNCLNSLKLRLIEITKIAPEYRNTYVEEKKKCFHFRFYNLSFFLKLLDKCWFYLQFGTIHILRQQMDFVGEVRKMVILLTFSTTCADVGWIRKSPKLCWRNIGMVLSEFHNTYYDWGNSEVS